MSRQLRALVLVISLAGAVLAGTVSASAAGPGASIGQPRFTVLRPPPGHAEALGRGPVIGSVPNWTGQFTSAGTTYPYTMVGTDPGAGSATTRIPVTIVPLKLTFSTGQSLDGTKRVKAVKRSPLFQDARFASGTTQYGDAMRRAEFWDEVKAKSPHYHVRLAPPTVARDEVVERARRFGHGVCDP